MAKLGTNPSSVWRGIIAAQDLIVQGSRVKIDSAFITTPVVPELQHTTVSNLLKNDSKDWDRDLIRDIFNEKDASSILRIPLSMSSETDSWFWVADAKGSYTVKSGYRMLCNPFAQDVVSGSSFDWLKLWSLPIPPKVKNFMWRTLHISLPTLTNLQGRHVEVVSLCPVCRMAEENLDHVLYHCPFSQSCWDEIHLNIQMNEGSTTRQWLKNIFKTLASGEISLLCVTAWAIWSHRNALVWRNKNQSPASVVSGARNFLFQWQQAQNKTAAASITNSREGSIIWQKPPTGWMTCNVDAATFEDRNFSSFGCLIRDSSGSFVAGYGGQLQGISDPKIAEVMAFREALSWLKRREASKVCIELDALSIVQAVRRKNEDDRSYFGAIILDCLAIIKELRSSCVYFVRRSANIAAHTLAREASSMSDYKDWCSVPSCLIDVLVSDNL